MSDQVVNINIDVNHFNNIYPDLIIYIVNEKEKPL